MRKREPRLQFTEEERNAPVLESSVKKAENAARKADKAQAKIPTKTGIVKERTVDPATGRASVRLRFEEVDKKKPPSKLTHAVKDAPAHVVTGTIHREIRQEEQDNVAVEAAHKSEETAEATGHLLQHGYHAHKLKPYRNVVKAERRLEKTNVNVLYRKSMEENPELYSNPVSRWQQKRAIKKQYAQAKRTGDTATTATENVAAMAQKAAEGAKKTTVFVYRHRRGFGIVIGFFLLLSMMLNSLSSCSLLFEGVLSGVASTTYPSEDSDMLGAEAAYAAMENQLQYELDHYERLHPDYDEYIFELQGFCRAQIKFSQTLCFDLSHGAALPFRCFVPDPLR